MQANTNLCRRYNITNSSLNEIAYSILSNGITHRNLTNAGISKLLNNHNNKWSE